VYADSLNSVSAPDYRFSKPGIAEAFERSIAAVENLPCDILLAPHSELIDLDAKLARWKEKPAENPLIDTSACKAYAGAARERLAKRLGEERAAKP
jgi:metallo-beta-lactamase class B